MAIPQQEAAVTKHIGQLKFDCVLCSEVYKNPRLLPCSHTYCLKCLERLGADLKPGHYHQRYYLVKICGIWVGCSETLRYSLERCNWTVSSEHLGVFVLVPSLLFLFGSVRQTKQ